MFVRFLFVFDLLFNLFRIALWPSVGFSLVLFLVKCRLNCRRHFLVSCLEHDMEFDCIGSWSFYLLSDHLAWRRESRSMCVSCYCLFILHALNYASPYARSFRRSFFAYHHAVNHPHKISSYHDLAFL